MNIEQIEDEQNRAAKEILNAAVVDAIKRLTQIRPGDVMIIANPKPIRFEIGMISEAEQKREQEWIRQSWTTLHYSMGDCLEGLTLPQAVELLVSQRENARNACAYTQDRCEKLEAVLRVLLSPDTQIEWSPQVSAACGEGERLLKEVK